VSDTTGSFAGIRITGTGFGTMRFRSAGVRPPPPAASNRAYLRSGLPAIYQDEDFGMRFVGGLETLLDPVVGLLDALPAHFNADLAPSDVLELLTAWLGIELREAQPTEERREIVRRAAELGRRRGTKAGLDLVLELGFPGLPFRVEDAGGVHFGTDAEKLPEAPPPSFVVFCDVALPEEKQADVARLIEEVKPANASYRLRVKTPRAPRKDAS
jgi:phage tail-like protein